MVVYLPIRDSITSRAPLGLLDCLSAIDLAVEVAQTFHYFLRLHHGSKMDGMIVVCQSDILVSIEHTFTFGNARFY